MRIDYILYALFLIFGFIFSFYFNIKIYSVENKKRKFYFITLFIILIIDVVMLFYINI